MARARRALVGALVLAAGLATSHPAAAQTTALFISSEPGDNVGRGIVSTFVPSVYPFMHWSVGNQVSFRVQYDTNSAWYLDFAAPANAPLTVGTYAPAGQPGRQYVSYMRISGPGGCYGASGRFEVLEAVYGEDGKLLQFAVDVEDHCSPESPALFAAFRYNSTISSLVPFGGAYPRYALTLAPSAHGTITGDTLACGAGQSACAATYGGLTRVSLTAQPEPGYVFTGWTGACYGGPNTTVVVNGVRDCGATFEPDIPNPSRTLLAIYSAPGERIGGGRQELYASTASAWKVAASNGGIVFDVYGLGEANEAHWAVWLRAPKGPLLETGTYENAIASILEIPLPMLRVSRESTWCTSSGRFDVLEAVYDDQGNVVRFAADIEQHCDSKAPALFIALRYNSTVGTMVPFGSLTPRFELKVVPDPNGVITVGGVECGADQDACTVALADVGRVTLSAAPARGYLFTGWTGACSGEATTTVLVNTVQSCGATFEPLVPTAARTLLFVDSMPGDSVGQGRIMAISGAAAAFTMSVGAFRGTIVEIRGIGDTWWNIDLGPDKVLTPGLHAPALRLFSDRATLDVSGDGRGCNQLSGRYQVLEVEYAADGTMMRLAVDVEQHCEGRDAALFLALRYNSALPAVPFGGQYPRYELEVEVAPHGRVQSEALACSGSAPETCRAEFASPTDITMTARPDPGYLFTGWTGACFGGQTTTVRVHTVRRCAATFASAAATEPRTVIYFESAAGDYAGRGRTEVYSPANSTWTAEVPNLIAEPWRTVGLRFQLQSVDELDAERWTMEIQPVAGSQVAVGTYTGVPAARSTTLPGFSIGQSGGCSRSISTFTLHELELNEQTRAIEKFALDFEQRCTSYLGVPDPPLTGSIRINSTVPLPLRGVSIAAERPSPFFVNNAIKWMATAQPQAGVEYAFWRLDGSAWSLVRPYDVDAAYTWTPAFRDVGVHTLQVWARLVGSSAAYEVWNASTFSIEPRPVPKILELQQYGDTVVGRAVEWTAWTSGGITPLQFQFWRRHGSTWILAQDYSNSATYKWTPTNGDVGTQSLQVWVRGAGSTGPYDATAERLFTVRAPDPLKVLLSENAPTSPAGRELTWSAVASGGSGAREYQFWRLDADGWKMVRDYGSTSSYAWIAGTGDIGSHSLQVWVRNVGSAAAFEAWQGTSFTITAPEPLVVSALTMNSASVLAGRTIQWRATAAGGTAPLEYQFWRRDGGEWRMVRDYGVSPVYWWTPGATDVGNHALQVWARSAGSSAAFESSWGVVFDVGEPQIIVGSLLSNVTTESAPGRAVYWQAQADGGVGPLQYQFWRLDGSTWKLVQDYSESNSYWWAPLASDAGTHVVQVWIRNAGSTKPYDAWRGTEPFVIR